MLLSFQYPTREENRQIKAGDSPEAWGDNKRSQKDVAARWTMKHGKTHYGYKNHIRIDSQVRHHIGRSS
ncbi:hypothetical protein [Candidatus Vondammii sp. HM_W22]|uniref:hypothetical protein n=1 Tax=Candidatus Vondammii sp. HM_W22 TaxID=2687299 RepID=UPI00403D9E82